MSIITGIMEKVVEVAKENRARNVKKINIEIGELQGIVAEYFNFCFDIAKKETVAKDAELNLAILKAKLRCRKCKREFEVEDMEFYCPFCNAADVEIIQGKELVIKSIEVED